MYKHHDSGLITLQLWHDKYGCHHDYHSHICAYVFNALSTECDHNQLMTCSHTVYLYVVAVVLKTATIMAIRIRSITTLTIKMAMMTDNNRGRLMTVIITGGNHK